MIGPIGIETAVDYCNRNIKSNYVSNCNLKLHPIRSQTKTIITHQYKKLLHCIKGQIISKGLFGILGFFQKTNEEIRF